MTPAARMAAAIEILDQWLGGGAALEQSLTSWARRSRFAGSKDRAAIRDLVFDAARRRRSDAALGGGATGRGLILGALRRLEQDPDQIFGQSQYAPPALSDDERFAARDFLTDAERLDIPDWLWPSWCDSLGENAQHVAAQWQDRAPVFVRVNAQKSTRERAQASLSSEGIETVPNPLSPWALEVTKGERKIKNSPSFASGVIEMQDAGSQATVAQLTDLQGKTVLDYCAGGGGKSLALAAAGAARVAAHDINETRMKDIPQRAKRAGVKIDVTPPKRLNETQSFDVVFCDAPCSGSGSWRRAPDGKWSFTAQRLGALTKTQVSVLSKASQFVQVGGQLIYVTCSMLDAENSDVVETFLDTHNEFTLKEQKLLGVKYGADGFFFAHLERKRTVIVS